MTGDRSTSRRAVLKATGALVGAGAASGCTGSRTTPQDGERPVPEGPAVGLESVAEGLTAPTDLQVADEEADRRFVVDQTGQIRVHGPDGLEDEPFLDLSGRLVDLEGGFDERGLLGLAFHPDFAENGRFFVRYSAPPRDADPGEYRPPRESVPDDYDHTFVLSEFGTAGDDNDEADPDSERVLLEIPQPQANHNAGPIAFGPDGLLYVATGDGGGAGDAGEGHVEDWYDGNEGGNGQNTTENLLGGILRIDVDGESGDGENGGRPYAIPEDNPFAEGGEFDSGEGLAEYYAWGFRNPWGMSFRGDALLVADVGQALFEEVDLVEKGGNYGWNVREGTRCFDPESPREPPEGCPDETPADVRGGEPLLDPVVEYPQERDGDVIGRAVVGGHVYEGDALPDLRGAYVFGDWGQTAEEPEGGTLFVARPPDDADLLDDGEADLETLAEEPWELAELRVDGPDGPRTGLGRYLLGLGRGADGELYALTAENSGPRGETGEVVRLVTPER